MDAGHHLTLRDGSEVVVRPIGPDDKDALLSGFNRLSPESVYRRFFTALETLGPSQLAYLTEVDHHDHEALIAFEAGTRDAIGVGRFVRTDDGRAEAAVTVVDEWQGRGLGMALTSLLAERALEEGIECFTALLLSENEEMMGLLASLGSVRTIRRDGGTVEVEVPLQADRPGAGRELYGVLRTVGSRAAALARPPRREGE
jgi:RimJ/RimL family protein N-acetyltransferase